MVTPCGPLPPTFAKVVHRGVYLAKQPLKRIGLPRARWVRHGFRAAAAHPHVTALTGCSVAASAFVGLLALHPGARPVRDQAPNMVVQPVPSDQLADPPLLFDPTPAAAADDSGIIPFGYADSGSDGAVPAIPSLSPSLDVWSAIRPDFPSYTRSSLRAVPADSPDLQQALAESLSFTNQTPAFPSQAVPEPSSAALLAVGCFSLGVLALARRRPPWAAGCSRANSIVPA